MHQHIAFTGENPKFSGEGLLPTPHTHTPRRLRRLAFDVFGMSTSTPPPHLQNSTYAPARNSSTVGQMPV